MINVRKQDLLNIRTIICFSCPSEVNLSSSCNYLSNLECLRKTNYFIILHLFNNYLLSYYFVCYLDIGSINIRLKKIRIEGISSLKSLSLNLESIEECYFANMYSLRKLKLYVKNEINIDMLTKLLELCPKIEELALNCHFSNINFGDSFNLKELTLNGNGKHLFSF